MTHAQEARLDVLDTVLDSQQPVDGLSADLFAVVDVLEAQPTLRRGLTDPSTPTEAREALTHGLFDTKVLDEAVEIVANAAAQRWSGGREFTAAVERQGVRAALRAAAGEHQLDDVEDELFRFERLVQAEPGLRDAIGDRTVPLTHRQDLVGNLLEGKVKMITAALAKRAVKARERTFAATVEGYLNLAAEARNRATAVVRVARPLDEEQSNRLRAVLARQVGREVDLQVIVDASVLGGVRVELGDEVIEGTVAGRLKDARQRFH